MSEQSPQPESRMGTKKMGIVPKKHEKKGNLVAVTLEELLKMDFGDKPEQKIYQRPKDAHPNEGVFWDTYLHPRCVEMTPKDWRSTKKRRRKQRKTKAR